jgi:hypothetical protein
MAVNLPYVNPGDPMRIKADAYNAFVDAAKLARDQPLQAQLLGGRKWNSTLVNVQNKTGAALDQYAVVALGNPVIPHATNANEFLQNWAIEANAPGAPSANETIAILREPLGVNKFGLATVAGLTPVKLSVSGGETSYQWAEISTGVTANLVMSNTGGIAKIVSKESGSGTKWAVVELVGAAKRLPTGWTWTATKTANYTAASGEAVVCDASGGGFSVSLPPSPAINDQVLIAMVNHFATPSNYMTVDPNGNKVNGSSSGWLMAEVNGIPGNAGSGGSWLFVYSGNSDLGWAASRYLST